MPRLPADLYALLRTEVRKTKYAAKTDAEVAAELGAATRIPNPVAAPTVPTPMNIGEMLGLVSSTSLANVMGATNFEAFQSAVGEQRHATVAQYLVAYAKAGWITGYDPNPATWTGELAALYGYVTRSGPDSRHPTLVDGPSASAALGLVDATGTPVGLPLDDIREARA